MSLSLIFFILLYEVLAQADSKKAHTQKQQNVSPHESSRSHAKPIFFSRLNKLQQQKGRRKWEKRKGLVMIRVSKLREDAPQTSNEKNKSAKKWELFLFLRT